MVEISKVKVYDLEESIIASGYPMRTELTEKLDTATKRAERLAKLGNGHSNFLKGIRVSFDIKYPQYITPQLQRYLFNDIVSSQSKMHKLKEMNIKEFCNKYVTHSTLEELIHLQEVYNSNPTYYNYMRLISNCPLGLELTMRCSTNYMCLKNIYKQRKNHKLKEDWGAFCKFVELLPMFDELIK